MIPKFRAFWKTEKKIIDVRVIDWNNQNIDSFYPDIEIGLEDVILMQSTGLFDKNGVEVFIGDIVRCSQGCPHEVVFIREFGGMFVGGMPTIYLSDISEGYAWTGNEVVIGNIYENPDLVEGRNEPKQN